MAEPLKSIELCVACSSQPFDLICTCGDKFDFVCINVHAEEIRLEFDFVLNQAGERLLKVEEIKESNNCADARNVVENWVCIEFIFFY